MRSEIVYVVNQNDPAGRFDETKIILGCRSEKQAKKVYHRNYQRGWDGFRSVVPMTVPQFKAWLPKAKEKKPVEPLAKSIVSKNDLNSASAKVPKSEVGYNSIAEGHERCGDCTMFRSGSCSIVSGKISPDAVCELWTGSVEHVGKSIDASPKYGCVMANLSAREAAPINLWRDKRIPDDALTDDGKEPNLHVTVKYGLTSDDPSPIEAIAAGITTPITADTGDIMRFTTHPDYDVLVVSIVSPDLVGLNAAVKAATPCVDTFPVYIPHMTLAYVKKGALPHLDGNSDLAGHHFAFRTLEFSTADKKQIWIHTGAPGPVDQSDGRGWYGVDFDGSIAKHTGDLSLGAPVPRMVKRVKKWLRQGRDVRIFTARAASDKASEDIPAIRAWCKEHLGQTLPVTAEKDPHMIRLYDDRARHVKLNTGKIIKSIRFVRLKKSGESDPSAVCPECGYQGGTDETQCLECGADMTYNDIYHGDDANTGLIEKSISPATRAAAAYLMQYPGESVSMGKRLDHIAKAVAVAADALGMDRHKAQGRIDADLLHHYLEGRL
jgi:hypothetical protein